MAKQEILNYIKQQLEAGTDREKIKKSLLDIGWNEKDIEEAFRASAYPSDPAPIETIPKTVESFQSYAGFWRRVAASFIDSFITFTITVVIAIILISIDKALGTSIGNIWKEWSSLLIFWLYYSLMESSSRQATVGKMILGIKVIDINNNRISFGRATGRTFAKIISVLTLGIGFLMVGFTKKKQALHDMIAGCLVVKYKKSHFLSVLLVVFLSFLLFLSGIGAYIYFVKWPQWKQNFFTGMEVISEPKKISDIEPRKEKTVELPKELVNLTEAKYDNLLSKPLSGLEGVNVGPAVLELSDFWKGESPHIWIKVKLPIIPNFNIDSIRLTTITIDKVQNKNGQNVYDIKHTFEKDTFFHTLNVSEKDYPVSHLYGIRDVRLIFGTNEDDISSIKGKLILQLPINIKELSFSRQELGKQKSLGDVMVTVNTIKKSQVLWKYQGNGDNYIDLRAYNSAGKELESASGSSRPSRGHDYTKPIELKSLFNGDIASVEIFIASQIAEREYPFVLTR